MRAAPLDKPMDVECPLIIQGRETLPNPFPGKSIFYYDYTYPIAQAGPLDIAQAIGATRQADRQTWSERRTQLHAAADAFSYGEKLLEHTIRITGAPRCVVASLLEDIPEWLCSVPKMLEARLNHTIGALPAQVVGENAVKHYAPLSGFCYAVTPGNDPRSTALVAANACALGLPFILAASPLDAVAPLVVRALIAAGFDPRFCQLIYFRRDSDAARTHFHLVDAASAVWTFGPDESVDRTLRYEEKTDTRVVDHFEGKRVLRHNSGNCAAISIGPVSQRMRTTLWKALDFPLGCTATKTLLSVDAPPQTTQDLSEWFASKVVGDPLDPKTEIGYTHPHNIDLLEGMLEKCRLYGTVYGGERLNPYQSRPALIHLHEEYPDLLRQEIPAHVLTLLHSQDVPEALAAINRHTGAEPRLAVSLLGVPEEHRREAIATLRTHAVLVDRPTSEVTPSCHEGNDYLDLLTEGRLVREL